jgi:transposase
MLPAGVAIYLAIEPVDLRGGFDRLSGIVAERLRGDPRAGGLYVFTNRRRTHAKVLFYDRSGYCVLYKRLDRGTFPVPTVVAPGASGVEISSRELELLLAGIDLPKERRAPRKKSSPSVH